MLLALLPSSRVFGLDYSGVSVALAKKENAAAVQASRCEISMGDIAALPYGEGAFDVVTSFEIITSGMTLKSAPPRFCGCSGGPADGCILQAMTTTQESQIRRWSTMLKL